jgi:hypothetical protein
MCTLVDENDHRAPNHQLKINFKHIKISLKSKEKEKSKESFLKSTSRATGMLYLYSKNE